MGVFNKTTVRCYGLAIEIGIPDNAPALRDQSSSMGTLLVLPQC